MRADPRPNLDDLYAAAGVTRPSLFSRARGVILWALGLGLLAYMLVISAIGFLMA
jgi:hypothetical protein